LWNSPLLGNTVTPTLPQEFVFPVMLKKSVWIPLKPLKITNSKKIFTVKCTVFNSHISSGIGYYCPTDKGIQSTFLVW